MGTPVVLITGALSGIGRAAARAFAQEGHRTVVAGRHEEAGQKLVTELRALGTEAEFFRTDVRHEDEVRDLVDRTVARFGRLDVAVNSAGTEGQPGPVTQQTADTYAATFDTNVLGTLLSMKHELRVMLAHAAAASSMFRRPTVMPVPATPPSTPPASTRSRGSPHPPRSRSRARAFASTRWHRGRPRPGCSIALPAMPKERPASSRACRSVAQELPTRSPMRSFSVLPTKRRSPPAKCFRSMVGSRRRNPRFDRR